MKYAHIYLSLMALLLVTTISQAAGPPSAPAPPAKPRSGGIFVDSAGHRHPWEINEAHTLIWDGSPYIPVGGMFCSKYLTSGQTDANWNEDVQGLQTLKSKGITDLYINPVIGATAIPPEAWQKLIDYLDSEGFRYGIELTDGPNEPLNSYIVSPQTIDVRPNSTFAARYENATSVAYAILDAEGNLIDSGTQKPEDGEVMIRIPSGGKRIAIATNEPFAVGPQTGLQNYWDGFGGYRDRVLALFSKIKLGPGFRFFVDPFINEMGMRGKSAQMIPDSPAFRMELQVSLEKRYRDIEGLVEKWIPEDEAPKDFESAARLIPLQQGNGVVFDPQTGKFSRCTSWVWADIAGFRDKSIQRYMNLAASVLKRSVADVPVIYKWTSPNPIFTNDDATGGFDGLGMEAYAKGINLAKHCGVEVLSQAEDAARTQWLLVTETQDTASPQKPDLGYPSEIQMDTDLDWLMRSGAKGFFVFGFQLLPQPTWNNFELLRDPRQLDWLANYRKRIESIAGFDEARPRTFCYPASAGTSASVRLLDAGEWFAPTKRPGQSLGLPEGLDGYFFTGDTTCVIWSTVGKQSVVFAIPKGAKMEVFTADDRPIKIKPDKRGRVTLELTEDPIQIRGLQPIQVFPPDIARKAMDDFARLLDEADNRKLNTFVYRQTLRNARIVFTEPMARVAYDMIRVPMERLKQDLAQVIWIEGEDANSQTFTGIVADANCTGGRYLKLWNGADPTSVGYYARYNFEVKSPGNYDLWLAGTPTGTDWSSPISYVLDSDAPVPANGPMLDASQYNNDFAWSRLGKLTLTEGKHTLEIRVTGRRKSPDTDYVFYIDALALSKGPFKPNTGVHRSMQPLGAPVAPAPKPGAAKADAGGKK